jgi:protein TonB
MGQEIVATPRAAVGRVRVASGRRRVLRIAVLLSVAFHLAAAALIVLLPRMLPQEARPQEQGTVELLMVEQKGTEASPGGQPQEAKTAPAQPEQAATKAAEAAPPAVPSPSQNGDEPTPAPAQPSPTRPEGQQQAANQIAAPPTPTRAPEVPVFDFEGTESESNAIVFGGHVLPAMRDDRFRNRPPIYPVEAEIRGDHGSVVVVIHVSETGIAAGVDVAESSGVSSLDQAAVAAVLKWHFHPAMKAGHTVPFDMPFRFVFQAD